MHFERWKFLICCFPCYKCVLSVYVYYKYYYKILNYLGHFDIKLNHTTKWSAIFFVLIQYSFIMKYLIIL